jgi:YVTN family beta-propeller protein
VRSFATVLTLFPIFGINLEIYPSPPGDFLWAPCFSSNNVYKVNVETHEVVAVIAVGGGPAGVAVGPYMVYITCRYSSRLYCISKFYDAVIDSFELNPDRPLESGWRLIPETISTW